jgi:hypothetical protein
MDSEQGVGRADLTAREALDFVRQFAKDYRAACDIGAEPMYGEATYAAGTEDEIDKWDSVEEHLHWHYQMLEGK